jgi:hypothetical protein
MKYDHRCWIIGEQSCDGKNPSYPVTWEELRNMYVDGLSLDKYDEILLRKTCSHPLPAAPTNTTGFTSSEIIHLAENDWHCREERRNIHPMVPWTQGWITGFLTPTKPDWIRIKKDAIAAQARAEVLEIEKAWRNDPHPSRDILNPFREICVQCVKDIGYEDACCDPSECVADAQVDSLRQPKENPGSTGDDESV